MSRTEFWAMHPREFWWLYDARRPRRTFAGGMSESDVADLYDEMKVLGVLPHG